MAIPTNPLGKINPPPGVDVYSNLSGSKGIAPGLVSFLNNGIKLVIVIAGLYAFINVIMAGYQFMSAGGDSKQVEKAVGKLTQSLIGLFLVAGSFVLAAIFGWLLFQDAGAILFPQIYTPNPNL
ncbi:hypothetical protein COT44_03485 [Candidatus Shapirobacteria bacterium CG08_land_8_20_14_0_20_39_18]|uniref:Integral membrane protein n=1 Tax=Candidatus Shapirobacteria bacterium CG08_land_8_20_14_0_20_39_18 TaxID=1974883 RepID=A0A2M6XCS8_9BACT|nr:MAG: hypothetical protein COT44_03485 [Candidatus Shapirobacteria bacterium CG08_land_8_20_14_0_20_39_18]